MKFTISIVILLISIIAIVFSRPEDYVEIDEYDENEVLINQLFIPISQIGNLPGYGGSGGMLHHNVNKKYLYRIKIHTWNSEL